MKVSPLEAKILSAVQFRANASASELASLTGLKPHVINYHLSNLRERSVLRRWAFIDTFALGYNQYGLYFSLSARSSARKAAVVKWITEHPGVAWFAELGGDFQYGLTLCARGINEVEVFLQELVKNCGELFFKKSVTLVSSFTVFAKKYLVKKLVQPPIELVSLKSGSPSYQADSQDLLVLSALCDPTVRTNQDMARLCGMARTTFEYRMKKLEAAGVIKRHINHISASRLGMQVFRLLIFVRGAHPALDSALIDFCRKHPRATNLTKCFGSWDFEVGLDLVAPQDASDVAAQLYEQFESSIAEIRIIPVFRQTNSVRFLKSAN